MSKVNRDIERKQKRREKVQVKIAAEHRQSEAHLWPELTFIDELERELKQAVSRPAAELFSELDDWRSPRASVSDVYPEILRQFYELLASRGEERTIESLSEAAELAVEIEKVTAKMGKLPATADGVFETMAKLLSKSDEFQRLADEKQRQSQLEDGRSAVLPAEKRQEPIQRQERLKQRQRKWAKERDQGME